MRVASAGILPRCQGQAPTVMSRSWKKTIAQTKATSAMVSNVSTSLVCGPDDSLHHRFVARLGSVFTAADHQISEYDLEFIPKIKLDINRSPPAGAALDLVHEQYDC